MSYLRGAGAVGTGAGAGDVTSDATGGELCPTVRGGEEGRTRGLKMSPPWVLAMLGLGKGWREWRISATPENQNTRNYENVQLKMRKCNQN